MLNTIGTFLSTLYLILYPSRPKLTYCICCLIQVLSYFIITLSYFDPKHSEIYFGLGLFLQGLGRGVFVFPLLLLHQTFNRPNDVTAVNIWIALTVLGGVYGYLIG